MGIDTNNFSGQPVISRFSNKYKVDTEISPGTEQDLLSQFKDFSK